MDFDTWMRRVDRHVWRLVGVSVHDLPDCPFREWFDDGTEPSEAALAAVEMADAGFEAE